MGKTPTASEDVSYLKGGVELIDRVAPMWESLNRHHEKVSPHFGDRYPRRAFSDRRTGLLEKSEGGGLFIELALHAGRDVGYCICTMSKSGVGEVDSIFVDDSLRGRGIGERLMSEGLDWLKSRRAKAILLEVAAGNERTHGFYRRFGFLPSGTWFMHKDSYRS